MSFDTPSCMIVAQSIDVMMGAVGLRTVQLTTLWTTAKCDIVAKGTPRLRFPPRGDFTQNGTPAKATLLKTGQGWRLYSKWEAILLKMGRMARRLYSKWGAAAERAP